MDLKAGVLALRELNAQRAKAHTLYCFLETGHIDEAVCFADGVQLSVKCVY